MDVHISQLIKGESGWSSLILTVGEEPRFGFGDPGVIGSGFVASI